MPKVSIIMNCYNSSAYLREAIESVYAQTYTDWEIIFWDDESTDDSLKIAQSYDQKVRIFSGKKASSLGEARNLAIKEAKGEYIAFLDCDDVWLPTKLEKQVARFETDKEVGLVFSDALFFNARGEQWPVYGAKTPPEGRIFRKALVQYTFALVAVMVRSSALKGMTDAFDARFGFIEEMDLFLRVMHDWKAAYVPEVLAKYRMHDKSWTFSRGMFFPQEKEILIEKLSGLYPEFKSEYANEIVILKAHIAYERFLQHWRKGEASTARQVLKPVVSGSLKYTIFYYLSFFPFNFYLKLRKFLGKKYYTI
jgi:glycosyltransferase involved in cell wall biosynthesis